MSTIKKTAKVSAPLSNDFCPQSLFLYGTYKEDGKPNFGLFCWFSYLWDAELGVMACIGGNKLTKDRIHSTRMFSANLVTESLLPLADYFGNKSGYDADKLPSGTAVTQGSVLDVPVLEESPVTFELEVKQFIPLESGEVMLCKIRNVLHSPAVTDTEASPEQRLRAILPVHTTCSTYFGWNGQAIGAWGEPMKDLKR